MRGVHHELSIPQTSIRAALPTSHTAPIVNQEVSAAVPITRFNSSSHHARISTKAEEFPENAHSDIGLRRIQVRTDVCCEDRSKRCS